MGLGDDQTVFNASVRLLIAVLARKYSTSCAREGSMSERRGTGGRHARDRTGQDGGTILTEVLPSVPSRPAATAFTVSPKYREKH